MNLLHDPGQMIGFLAFSAVAAGTPGPSNAVLTAVGSRAGIRGGLPSLLGQVAGMSAMMFAIALGLGKLLLAHPLALQILKWGGAAMLCWMAWRIATARPAGATAGPDEAATGPARATASGPAGFGGMVAFQWVNPKGWLIGVAAVATFLDQRTGTALGQALAFAILFALIALPSCFPWLAFGAGLQRFLRVPRVARVLNIVMAALLAGSAVVFVWGRF
jgi:threonine/homoserine/homoserine lactone efflux protein